MRKTPRWKRKARAARYSNHNQIVAVAFRLVRRACSECGEQMDVVEGSSGDKPDVVCALCEGEEAPA